METTSTSINRWMDKVWHIHTTGYYSAKKSNVGLTRNTTWTNLTNIILSQRERPTKTTHYMTALPCNVQSREIYRHRKWISGCHGFEEGWKEKESD